MRVRSILRGAAIGCLALCLSCQSGIWKQYGDSAAKGSAVGAGAAAGAALAGPGGALIGGIFGYFSIELAEVKVQRNRAAEATASAQQANADQMAAVVMGLSGNPEAMQFFREQATAVAEEKVGVSFMTTLKILAGIVIAYFLKQLWSVRRLDEKIDKKLGRE